MNSKTLYPNFHAEIHRYKVSSTSLGHEKVKDKQSPSRQGRSRPHSSSVSKEVLPGTHRSSCLSSSQKYTHPMGSGRGNKSNNNHTPPPHEKPATTATSRRRVLPHFMPAVANQYAVLDDPSLPSAKPISGFARQKSFCRLEDLDDAAEHGACTYRTNNEQDVEYGPELTSDCFAMNTQRSSSAATVRKPSRQTAIRGELGIPSHMDKPEQPLDVPGACGPSVKSFCSSPRSLLAMAPKSSHRGAHSGIVSSSLQGSTENLQETVFNARPRSRYARREHSRQPAQTLDRILTAPSMLTSASLPNSPSTAPPPPSTPHNPQELVRNKSTSALLSGRESPATSTRGYDLVGDEASKPEGMVSWGQDDMSSFFLTEIDAKAVENQWRLARCVARGSFLLYGTGEYAKAAGVLSEALELAQGIGDEGLVALLQHHIGIAFKEDGKLKWARTMQEKALVSAQRSRENRIQGRALKALGVIAMDTHDLEEALDRQQEALTVALNEKDLELEARVYANLGNIASSQMQFGHALSCHQRDLKLSTSAQLGSRVGQLRAHRNLALVYAKLSKTERQTQHEQQAAFWGDGSRAFDEDMRNHLRDGIGNIYMQLSKRDPKLEDMVASSVSEIAQKPHQDAPTSGDSDDVTPVAQHPVAIIQPVQIKQVLITRANDKFRPPRTTMLGSSSSMSRLGETSAAMKS